MLSDTISHYRILEKLGEGGMGAVYLAEDTTLGRKVALKLLPTEFEADAQSRRRLLREARSAAAIDHPYSCKIYEVDEADGKHFIAMEYVDGPTLADVLREDDLSRERALEIAYEIAEALEKAHESGIVHRDLKPANVMLTREGHVKVMDFGLAKPALPSAESADEEATLTALTQLGATPGTPAYMSPEQVRGREATRRSDIFSFGVLLYEMVGGTHPFRRGNAGDTLAAILTDEPPTLTPRGVPDALQRLLTRLLQKDPDKRLQDFSELLPELARVSLGSTPGQVRGHWRLSAAVLVAAAVVVLLVWLLYPQGSVAPGTEPLSTEPLDVESLMVGDHESRARSLMQNFSNPGDLALSVEAWQRVGELRPNSAQALAGAANARALLAWNSRSDPDVLELAETEARAAIEIDPDEARAYVALATIYQLKGLLDTAETMSERSMELAPTDPWVLQHRARFLMDRHGEFAIAEELAQRAVEIDTDHFPAWFQLGWAQFEQERLVVAAESFRHSIALRPDFGGGHLGLGAVLNAQGAFEEARLSFDRALAIDPDSLQALFMQGLSLHYLGDPASALENFQAVTDRNPKHLLAIYATLYQAVELEALGRTTERDKSLHAAEQAFKSFPRLWWSLKGLAGVAAARGNTEEALAWLDQASQAGTYSVHQLLLDPALDSLEEHPGFHQRVTEARAAVSRDSR